MIVWYVLFQQNYNMFSNFGSWFKYKLTQIPFGSSWLEWNPLDSFVISSKKLWLLVLFSLDFIKGAYVVANYGLGGFDNYF
jgi:hypothetical protein